MLQFRVIVLDDEILLEVLLSFSLCFTFEKFTVACFDREKYFLNTEPCECVRNKFLVNTDNNIIR
jgi:hypothetical protein